VNDGATCLVARYPRVWHVIEAESAGPWLTDTGLLPAVALLHFAGLADDGVNRDSFRRLDLGGDGTAIVRPQLMQDARLLPTLAGRFVGDPVAWRRHINRHVFFWAEQRRRDAFLGACVRLRAADAAAPRVMVLDSAALLARHCDSAFFARFNTGSTVRGGSRVRRDESTLRPVADYRAGPIAELAISGRVDITGIAWADT
jgi:hypothetical protein